MAVANNEPNNLQTLENQLRELSHDDRVFTIIQDFADRLGKTKDRQKVFGAEGALVRQPIEYRDMLAKGVVREMKMPSPFCREILLVVMLATSWESVLLT